MCFNGIIGLRLILFCSCCSPFWDLVMLTASDEPQAESYRAQLQAKLERKEIPHSRYHVIPDPPGPKIGNGGATLEALRWLESNFGDQLSDCKIY